MQDFDRRFHEFINGLNPRAFDQAVQCLDKCHYLLTRQRFDPSVQFPRLLAASAADFLSIHKFSISDFPLHQIMLYNSGAIAADDAVTPVIRKQHADQRLLRHNFAEPSFNPVKSCPLVEALLHARTIKTIDPPNILLYRLRCIRRRIQCQRSSL